MKIKLICTDCKHEFSCEKGKEMRPESCCPRCGSCSITIPTIFDEEGNCHFVEETQRELF